MQKNVQRKSKQRAGSPASIRVDNLVQPGCPQMEMPKTNVPEGDLTSLNLYQTTGGGKKYKKNHRGGSPASKHVMKLVNKTQDGGSPASDHVLTFLNNPENSYTNAFEGTSETVPQKGGRKKKTSKKNSKKRSKKRSKKGSKNSHNKRGGGSSGIRDALYSRSIDVRQDAGSIFKNFTTDDYMTPTQLMDMPNQVANPPFVEGNYTGSYATITPTVTPTTTQSGGRKKKTSKKTKRSKKR